MTTSDKLREISDRHLRSELNTERLTPLQWEGIMRTIENVISEDYVEKAKYDEAVRQRDELREALKQIMFSSGTLKAVQDIAEAAIKNTER